MSLCRLEDAGGDVEPGLGRLGNAVFVHAQADDGGAVCFHNGQDAVQHLLLAVDRIDDGLAAVLPQAPFQRRRVGGVDLQGQIRNALDRLHNRRKHFRFVNFGQTYINIKDMNSSFLLLDTFAKYISNIIFYKCLFKNLFTVR